MNGTERAKGRFYRWTGVQILSWGREEGNFHMAEGNADTQTGDHIAIDREAYQTPKAKIKGGGRGSTKISRDTNQLPPGL